ncbi:hypothetical protein [Thomasclavelia sp.]|uniref:hypothetical protein n=1 Tax=Thomasclavelia sp. TaxID=3025757 RepID=UPI0025EECAC9|nr:hypothetical protein [Thomasclavelia sp.]
MYQIGDFIFTITGISEKLIPENLQKFKTKQTPQYHYHIDIVDEINILEDNFIVNRQTIKINQNNGLEIRYLAFPQDLNIYARMQEISPNQATIIFKQEYLSMLKYDTVFNSLLALERRMNNFNSYVLHSSYIVYQNQAILFSAPSGTGKSTQADLWKKYRNIEIINGDRTLLTLKDDCFFANGWPVCGSSEICFNQTYPIKAIVLLQQGKQNQISQLSYIEKTKRLLKEITINYHNQEYLDNALVFIEQLIKKIPIINLSCTISKEAVECLDDYLKEVVSINI